MEKPIINLEQLKQDSWTPEELRNVQLVIDFVQKLMNEHDFEHVLENYGKGAYIQHNRSMSNGVDGVVEYLKNFTRLFPEFSYDVKKIHADGQFVTLHSHSTARAKHRGNERKGFIIFDTWKVVNSELVEHWDSLQPLDFGMRLVTLLIGGTVKNKNGLF